MKKNVIALIAGGGELPISFLKTAVAQKENIIVVAIENDADKNIQDFGFKTVWFNIGKIGGIRNFLKQEKVKAVIMLGDVKHTRLFTELKFDFYGISILAGLKDKRAASLFGLIIKEIEKLGAKVLPSTYLMEETLAPKGAAGRNAPSKKERKEAFFAITMARALAKTDIGQTVVIKNGIVAAAEAQEGTDRCIERGATIAGKGFIVAKASRVDMRFDVPVIGLKTIALIKKYNGRGIIYDAARTFIMDGKNTIKAADKAGIYLYGMEVRK